MRRVTIGWTVFWLCLIGLPSRVIPAATNQVHVLDGAGGWASNSLFSTLTAVCQPLPVGDNSGTRHINHSGFLQAFRMGPARDTDADGIDDEGDPDDDNDGVTDIRELSGESFDPATATDPLVADADGDGMNDGAEAYAGTDPLDAGSVFKIIQISDAGPGAAVTWQSRDGYTYALLAASNIAHLATAPTVVTTLTAIGGTGPWNATLSTATNTPVWPGCFYRVEIRNRP